jgi:ABC-type hemin transport system ATPase subunit
MSDQIRLTRLCLRAGAKPDGPPLEVDVGNVVLLVGPNNSGKSLALREIRNWCSGQPSAPQRVHDSKVASLRKQGKGGFCFCL